jgi:hypothetical protein
VPHIFDFLLHDINKSQPMLTDAEKRTCGKGEELTISNARDNIQGLQEFVLVSKYHGSLCAEVA